MTSQLLPGLGSVVWPLRLAWAPWAGLASVREPCLVADAGAISKLARGPSPGCPVFLAVGRVLRPVTRPQLSEPGLCCDLRTHT